MSVEKMIQLNGLRKIASSRIQRRAMLVSLVVIAAAALYKWILAPYGGQLYAAQKYDFTLAGVLRKTEALSAALEKKKAKLQELTAESNRLHGELFTPAEAREFFTNLPAVAARTGCAIQSINAPSQQKNSPVSDGSGIIEKKAIVVFTGGYANIMGFMKELQNYRRKVWIDAVRMDAAGNAGKLRFTLTLTLYCADSMEMTSYE